MSFLKENESKNLQLILKLFGERRKKDKSQGLFSSFAALHNSDNYEQHLIGLTNHLTIQNGDKKYAESLLDLELQIHKGNCHEVHKCIKKHLGTSSHSKLLYSLIKKKSFIKKIKKTVADFLFRTKFGIVALNVFKVMLKIVFYYADIYKDVFFITQVSIGFTEF
jgi:hypothetical protein